MYPEANFRPKSVFITPFAIALLRKGKTKAVSKDSWVKGTGGWRVLMWRHN